MSIQASEQFIPEWTFGDRLRKARRGTGMTVEEFAAALGVGRGALGSWEIDKSLPRNLIAIARKVEEVSGVDAGWLVDIPGPPHGGGVEPRGAVVRQFRTLDGARQARESVRPDMGMAPAAAAHHTQEDDMASDANSEAPEETPGASVVRRVGLEPTTRCFSGADAENVIDFASRLQAKRFSAPDTMSA